MPFLVNMLKWGSTVLQIIEMFKLTSVSKAKVLSVT